MRIMSTGGVYLNQIETQCCADTFCYGFQGHQQGNLLSQPPTPTQKQKPTLQSQKIYLKDRFTACATLPLIILGVTSPPTVSPNPYESPFHSLRHLVFIYSPPSKKFHFSEFSLIFLMVFPRFRTISVLKLFCGIP